MPADIVRGSGENTNFGVNYRGGGVFNENKDSGSLFFVNLINDIVGFVCCTVWRSLLFFFACI